MFNNIKLSEYLVELKDLKIWIPWMKGTTGGKKPSLDGKRYAKWSDHSLFMTFDGAAGLQKHTPGLAGIGFIVQRPYVVIDLDDCFDQNGDLNPAASSIVSDLNAYCEYSPSMNGIHAICKAYLPDCKKLNTVIGDDQSLEIITPGNNFVTFTGLPLPGYNTAISDGTGVLAQFYKAAPSQHNTPPPFVRQYESHECNYGKTCLRNALSDIRSSHKGNRTQTLITKSFKVGMIIDHINENSATMELELAGQSVGLSHDKCKATVAKGIADGKRKKSNVLCSYNHKKLILLPD